MSGIRFHPKGPIIPYDLLRAQERGETVFLCGAGVSMGAGLPDFYNLVRGIYRRLHEDYNAHPAETEGMKTRAHCAPDRTLFALQERLRLGPERVLTALTQELETPSRGTAAHYDLLRLSRDSINSRLITTNFDTLFERAWADQTGGEIHSWAASGMPGPGSADFRGVFHLHGRLADMTLPHTLERSQLVLTSAEFGDAYLRSGWASRYLYDLLLHANVVIVGYSLNDPPLRYLFDALTADRHRFQFKRLYAIAPASPAKAENAEALWRARGAIPLLYDDRRNHNGFHGTVSGWAAYADNPTGWATNETSRILGSRPDTVLDEDWRRLDWIRANKLGSAKLFNATKEGLLWTFNHADEETLSDGQVLLLLQAAYSNSAGEPIELSSSEAKDALARAGVGLLDSLIPPDTGPARLNELLDCFESSDPTIRTDGRFLRLRGLAKRLAA